MDEKYVVLKRENWNTILGAVEAMGMKKSFEPYPLEGCVVIRLQDVYSTSALFTYADCIQTSIEVFKMMDQEPPKQLQEIADYFHEMANISMDYPRKIPD